MKQKILSISLMIASGTTLAMSEQAFIDRLTKVHPFFQQLENTQLISGIDRQATTANQDWVLSATSSYKDEDYGDVSSVTTYSDLETTSIDLSAKKQLVDSGASLTLAHTWKEKSKASTASVNTHRNKFSIDYSYPLLKDAGGINDRLNTDLADLDVKISQLDTLESRENFVLKYWKKFVELAYLEAQFEINQDRVSLAQKELKLVEDKFKASVVDKVDLLNQKDAYQRAKTQALQAEQELALLQYELALVLKLSLEEIQTDFNLYQSFQPAESNLEAHLSQHARAIRIADLKRDKLQRQLSSQKNQSLADLDLNLGLSSEGENADYDHSIENQGASYSLGLTLSYPLGATASNSAVQKTQVQMNNAEQTRLETLLELHTSAKVNLEKIRLLAEMLDLSKAQMLIAKDRAAEEQKRYADGNSQASVVISAQDNAMSARISYAKSAKNYQQAVLDYQASIDTLVQ